MLDGVIGSRVIARRETRPLRRDILGSLSGRGEATGNGTRSSSSSECHD